MALEEATRLVTVREGDKVSEIPAMQALLELCLEPLPKETPKRPTNFWSYFAERKRANCDCGRASAVRANTRKSTLQFPKHET